MYIGSWVSTLFCQSPKCRTTQCRNLFENIPLKVCMHISTEVMDEKIMQQKVKMYNFESTILQSGEKLIDNN
jgi:adenylate kinase family enzyme